MRFHRTRRALGAFAVVFAVLAACEATAAHAAQTLVAAGAVWKYLDDGSDQASAWRFPQFDDARWRAGPAQLGYGDGDEATVVGYGPNPNAKHITTYFRHRFTVGDRNALTALTLALKRDDGAVVYLNGTEVYRSNMPSGTIAYDTRAVGTAADDGATFEQAVISIAPLVSGENVLAVEVHQSSGASSDISFDLALVADTAVPVAQRITRGPYLQMGTASGLVVRWRTDTPAVGRVRYGPAPAQLDRFVDGAAATTEHAIALGALDANTRYYYAVGTTLGTLAGADADHWFVTAPAAAKPTRVWVLGDAGTRSNDQRAVRDAYTRFTGTRATDLWLMLGDNAYDSGTDAEYQQAVFDMYPQTLRNAVLWPTIGNHDTAGAGSAAPTLPYFRMFTLPAAGEAGGVASGTRNYYSFDYGNIHFVCLDSMASSRAPDGAMLTWLRADLAANAKPWLIAFWHHPPYSKGSHDSDIAGSNEAEMRQYALPILEAAGVDLVLTGHSHSYERSFLIDGHYGVSSTFSAANQRNGGDGRPDGQGAYTKPSRIGAPHEGAVYVVAGSSGQVAGGPLNHPAMLVSLANLGSLVIDVDGGRLDAKFLRENGAIADSFTLQKGAATPPLGNRPPVVSITAPVSGATVSGQPARVTLTANASDPEGIITRVEYFLGEVSMGSSTVAPFTVTWPFWTPGSYSVVARAMDNLGATSFSAPVVINVR